MTEHVQEPYEWDVLSNTIRELLDSVDSEGSFYAKGVLTDVNPRLEIEYLGSIGVPISQHHAQRLIQHSRQAPFGKGTETFVDTSVRNTWEIDAARVKCCHPKWSKFEEDILYQTCSQLGIPGGSEHVRAELYKLLVYEEGAMFKPHKDTEKAPQMFGTLVVALPSRHEGGDVSVSFNGRKEILQTSTASCWNTSYLAWYSDVLHEVKPVTSGYRIVLTYNLVHTVPSKAPGIANGDPRLVALQDVLKKWSHDLAEDEDMDPGHPLPDHLIYMLEHQYTDNSLCHANLKGADYMRVRGISSIAQAGECAIYLASIEKREHGGCDGLGPEDYRRGEYHTLAIVDEQSILLRSIVSQDGDKIAENVPVDEEEAIMKEDEMTDTFEGDPVDEDFEGWTGNEGANITLWYRKSALIIMPRIASLEFFLSATRESKESSIDNYCNVLRYYGAHYQCSPETPGLKEDLDFLLEIISTERQTFAPDGSLAVYSPEDWPTLFCGGRVVAATAAVYLRIGQPHEFTRLLRDAPQMTHKGLNVADYNEFLRVMWDYDFDQLKDGILDAINRAKRESEDNLDGPIVALCVVAEGLKEYLAIQSAALEPWIKTTMKELFSRPGMLTGHCLSNLVELCVNSEDPEWVEECVLPPLCANAHKEEFASDLYRYIASAIVMANEDSERDIGVLMLRILAPAMIASISLPRTPPAPKRPIRGRRAWDRYWSRDPSPTPVEERLLDDIGDLHGTLLNNSLNNEALMLLQRVGKESELVAPTYFGSLILPYIYRVRGLAREHFSLSGSPYEKSIKNILRLYQSRVVGPQPSEPTDWSRTPPDTLCSCLTCKELCSFIEDPHRQRTEFSVVFKVRHHIEKALGVTSKHPSHLITVSITADQSQLWHTHGLTCTLLAAQQSVRNKGDRTSTSSRL